MPYTAGRGHERYMPDGRNMTSDRGKITLQKGLWTMRYFTIALLCVVGMASSVSAGEPGLKGEKEKISYSMGMDLGMKLKQQSVEFDSDVFVRGLQDALADKKPLLTEQEIRETLSDFQKKLIAKQAEKMKEIAEMNKKEGDAWLEENKKKEGVVTLPSGLQYKVITEGTGKMPKETDTVTTQYRGTLIDGKEFDSSYKRGEAATFPVKGVIAGWKEALQLMKVGAKWQLFVPAELAYGERGAGNVIAPNSTLIFEVELLSIKE